MSLENSLVSSDFILPLVSKITMLQIHLKTKQEDKRSPIYGDRPSCWELFYKWKFSAVGEGAACSDWVKTLNLSVIFSWPTSCRTSRASYNHYSLLVCDCLSKLYWDEFLTALFDIIFDVIFDVIFDSFQILFTVVIT